MLPIRCPTGYDCRATAWMPGETRYRCMPTIGTPAIRCETSSPSMFGGNPAPGPASKAAKDGTFRIESRLGDLAVACFAGYVPKGGGAFVRLAMGLRRAVTVYPGQTTAGVKVTLDTPMTRRMTVELERLPMGPDTFGMRRELTAALDLDPEGYIHLADVATTQVTDRLVLERQPHFSGVHAKLPWTMYGSIGPANGGSPTAVAIREKMLPTAAERLVGWQPDANKPEVLDAYAAPVFAAAHDGVQTVVVGRNGFVGVWSGSALTQQQSPTGRDLYAVWLAQGLGMALMEEVVTRDGRILNPSFTDYIIPTMVDVPPIHSVIVERPDLEGPFGARGVGEPPLIGTVPAVLGAIADATGVPMRQTPATAERVWQALQQRPAWNEGAGGEA